MRKQFSVTPGTTDPMFPFGERTLQPLFSCTSVLAKFGCNWPCCIEDLAPFDRILFEYLASTNLIHSTGSLLQALSTSFTQLGHYYRHYQPHSLNWVITTGIVSLAAGTSEGNSANMPNFRHAQTASYGFLPGPPGSRMENTFIAQGYAIPTILFLLELAG